MTNQLLKIVWGEFYHTVCVSAGGPTFPGFLACLQACLTREGRSPSLYAKTKNYFSTFSGAVNRVTLNPFSSSIPFTDIGPMKCKVPKAKT